MTGEPAAIGAVVISATVGLAAASYLFWQPVPPPAAVQIADMMKHDFGVLPPPELELRIVKTMPIKNPTEVATTEQTVPPLPPAAQVWGNEAINKRDDNGYDYARGRDRHRDICSKYGGHRVTFMRRHHTMWRCVYPGRGRR